MHVGAVSISLLWVSIGVTKCGEDGMRVEIEVVERDGGDGNRIESFDCGFFSFFGKPGGEIVLIRMIRCEC